MENGSTWMQCLAVLASRLSVATSFVYLPMLVKDLCHFRFFLLFSPFIFYSSCCRMLHHCIWMPWIRRKKCFHEFPSRFFFENFLWGGREGEFAVALIEMKLYDIIGWFEWMLVGRLVGVTIFISNNKLCNFCSLPMEAILVYCFVFIRNSLSSFKLNGLSLYMCTCFIFSMSRIGILKGGKLKIQYLIKRMEDNKETPVINPSYVTHTFKEID